MGSRSLIVTTVLSKSMKNLSKSQNPPCKQKHTAMFFESFSFSFEIFCIALNINVTWASRAPHFFPFRWPNNRSFSVVLPPATNDVKSGCHGDVAKCEINDSSFLYCYFLSFLQPWPPLRLKYLLLPMKRRATFSLTDINLSRILLPWSFSPFTDVILKGRIHMRCMHKEKHISDSYVKHHSVFSSKVLHQSMEILFWIFYCAFLFRGENWLFFVVARRKTQSVSHIEYSIKFYEEDTHSAFEF